MVRKPPFFEYRLLTQHYPEGTRGSRPTTQVGVHTLPIPIVGGRWSPLADEYGSKNLIFQQNVEACLLACLLLLLLLAAYRSRVLKTTIFEISYVWRQPTGADPSGMYVGATTVHTPMAAMVLGRGGSCG
ncbi:MAG: hypothetical protein GY849_18345, partial [Deltaproteobacteria bacterium]|nr:hypothetical protein [Deltaproteobacteria bacterium]